MTKNGKMSAKEERFVSEYLITLNAADAARKAGYAQKSARMTGHKLLTKTYISDAIQTEKMKLAGNAKITTEMVIAELGKIAFASLRNFIELDGNGHPHINLQNASNDDLDALQDVQIETVLERRGSNPNGQTEYNRVRKTKVKLLNKLEALEKLAQYTGVYKQRDDNIATALAQAIADIQTRTSRAPISAAQ